MKKVCLSLLAITLIAAFAETAEAQGGFGRPTAGIFGGVTLPSGDFNDEVGTGWHAGGLVKMRAFKALDIRLDGTFNKFAEKEIVASIATVETYASLVHVNLDALVNLGPDSAAYPGDNTIAPYILAGVGGYRLDYDAKCTGSCEEFDAPTRNHFGLNIGGGATVPLAGIRTFVEARYHRMMRDVAEGNSRSFIVISAGVKFR